MLEDNAIKLDDGTICYVTKEIQEGNITYVFLTDLKQPMNFFVRKKDEAGINLINLDNEEEFYKAISLFSKINTDGRR